MNASGELVPPLARGLRMFVTLVAVLVLLSAILGIGASGLNAPPVWFTLGFEAIIAVAAVFGLLVGLGRYTDGPALALVCIAGAVGAGSLLGYLSGQGNLPVDLRPFLMARAAAAASMLAIAGYAVLARRPSRSWPRFWRGLACLAGLIATGTGLWLAQGWLTNLGTMAGAIAALLASVTLLGLLAAAVHELISAFEAGAVGEGHAEPPPREATAETGP